MPIPFTPSRFNVFSGVRYVDNLSSRSCVQVHTDYGFRVEGEGHGTGIVGVLLPRLDPVECRKELRRTKKQGILRRSRIVQNVGPS